MSHPDTARDPTLIQALYRFMRHLALELGPFGIRANAIAPSIVRNEKIEKFMPAEAQTKVAAHCRSSESERLKTSLKPHFSWLQMPPHGLLAMCSTSMAAR
jgi:NAD(P)-dependent dehydrogenase (short-subunit alcohol dehydrogenase family)